MGYSWTVGYWAYCSSLELEFRWWRGLILAYIEFDDCTLVVVDIAIVWSWEDCDDQWEVGITPLMHFVAFNLSFVSSDDCQKLICFQKAGGGFSSVEVRTSSNIVEFVFFLALSIVIVDRICPQEIAIWNQFQFQKLSQNLTKFEIIRPKTPSERAIKPFLASKSY